MWQLDLPDHSHWQVVDRSVTLIEEGLCDANSYITIVPASNHPRRFSEFKVKCERRDQSTLFSVTEYSYRDTVIWRAPRSQEVVWSGLTKEQLWHRLASAPDLRSVSVSLSVQVVAAPIAGISKP